MKKIFYFFVLLLLSANIYAESLNLERITGYSVNKVNDFAVSEKYIYIADDMGKLNVYDRFLDRWQDNLLENYSIENINSISVFKNYIFIASDSGLIIYDENLQNFEHDFDLSKVCSTDIKDVIANDKYISIIYSDTQIGIYNHIISNWGFVGYDQGLVCSKIYDIDFIDEDRILLGTDNGIWLYDVNLNNFSPSKININNLDKRIFKIKYNKQKIVAAGNEYVVIYDRSSDKQTDILLGSEEYNTVNDIIFYKDNILIGTIHSSGFLIDLKENLIKKINLYPAEDYTLFYVFNNVLWIISHIAEENSNIISTDNLADLININISLDFLTENNISAEKILNYYKNFYNQEQLIRDFIFKIKNKDIEGILSFVDKNLSGYLSFSNYLKNFINEKASIKINYNLIKDLVFTIIDYDNLIIESKTKDKLFNIESIRENSIFSFLEWEEKYIFSPRKIKIYKDKICDIE